MVVDAAVLSREDISDPVRAAADGRRGLRRARDEALTEHEIRFAKRLHALVGSPRSAKRFANIYRLLRASVTANERDAFVGNAESGAHRSVLALLAVMMGYPEQATDVLRSLLRTSGEKTFLDCVRASAGDAATSSSALARAERVRWSELLEKLEAVGSLPVSLDDYVTWAPRLARYSFLSGRLFSGAKREGARGAEVNPERAPSISSDVPSRGPSAAPSELR